MNVESRSVNWKSTGRAIQQGRTLVEIMVAMVIGVMVIGSILSTVITTSASTRTQDNLGKLSEDAQVALSLVAGHLRMAGFSRPRVNAGPGAPDTNYNGAAVRGCDGSITDITAAMTDFVCGPTNQPNAFTVAYEADLSNTLPGLTGFPTDCLAQELAPLPSPFGGQYFVAENRFFIRNNASGEPELACAGNGGPGFVAPQTLIENVEDMRLIYGMSQTQADAYGVIKPEGRVAQYGRADELDTNFALEPLMDRWLRVASVRVCLQLRTNDGVASQPTPYTDCTGNTVTPADRRLRIAVSTTVNVRNGTPYSDD